MKHGTVPTFHMKGMERDMEQIEKITVAQLRGIADRIFGNMVKADVDIARKLIVIDAELHADIEQFMLDNGSCQDDLWGINLYPDQYGSPDFIEFDSMINIKPQQGNRSRFVEDGGKREKITEIVNEVIVGDKS